MNEVILSENIEIENMIYEIRGKQVMLDSDLARLYKCVNGTKSINLAVSRNSERFPEDFYFQLTKEEYNNLKFQIETSNSIGNSGGVRKLPHAFTEQGVAMLATVLKTKVASQMCISIMRSFVKMRKYLSSNLMEQSFLNKQILKNAEDIKLLQESFKKIEEKRKTNEIYFNRQIFDAYSKILDIFKSCKNELKIIDAYADNTVLDIVKRLNFNVTIITKKDNLLTQQDILKYNKQYNNLKVIYDNSFHDRYFILDKEVVYHCGASINRIGYKTFSITQVSDEEVYKVLIDRIGRGICNE